MLFRLYDMSMVLARFLTPNIVRWLATHLTTSASQRWLWNVIDCVHPKRSPETLWEIQAVALGLRAEDAHTLWACLCGVGKQGPMVVDLPSAVANYHRHNFT